MSVVRRVLTGSCVVLLFAIGLVQALRWAGQPALREWIDLRLGLQPPAEGYAAWWERVVHLHAWWYVILLVPILTAVFWLWDTLADRVLSLSTESGHPLRIRATAVNRYLHDCLSSLAFIRGARVSSRASGGTLVTQVRVWVAASDKLDNLQQTILRKVAEDARQGLGLTRVQQPDILVESVKTRQQKAHGDATRGEPAERAPEPAGPIAARLGHMDGSDES